jgi:hypothetical protein
MSLVFGSIFIAYLLGIAGVLYLVWWLFFGK